MANENLGALLAAFDDDDVESGYEGNFDDTFVTAPCNLTKNATQNETFKSCLDVNEATAYQSAFEDDEFDENFEGFEEAHPEVDDDHIDDITPKASVAGASSSDRLRGLIQESRALVNNQTPSKTKHESSSAFPYSSNSLKVSTTQNFGSSKIDLSKKAAQIGKALTFESDKKNSEIFDSAFGIRVTNPKITPSIFSTYCSGFKKIRISHLRRTNIPKEDWVTMGVIVEKSECRKSANGNEYMFWKVSDLTNFQDTPIKVLLFGDSVKQHWKLQQSSVIALTTPQMADSTDILTFKIGKSAQVIEIGFCPEFGSCRAMKQDGGKCSNYVNTNTSEFCVYHIQKAAKSTLAQRAGLGSQYNSPIGCRVSKPKMGVRNGENKVVGSTQVFLNASKGIYKPEQEDAKPQIPTKSISKNEFKALKEQENEKLQAFIKGNKVNFGAKNLNKHHQTGKDNDIVKNAAIKPKIKAPTDVKAFLREQKLEQQQKSEAANFGDGLQITGGPTTSGRPKIVAEINRQKLIEKIKAQGGLAKVDPNSTRKRQANQMLPASPKPSTSSTLSILHKENDSSAATQSGSSAKKSKLGNKEYSAADIQALLGKKSTHENVIQAAELNKENQYFSNMEVREKIETRLTELTEIKDVKVVTCKKCDYTNEKQSSFCMIKGHLVQWHKANKRFFKCSSCKYRIAIFAIIPTKPCKNCGCTSFDRVGMKDERIIKEDKLQIRGDEIPFVNR